MQVIPGRDGFPQAYVYQVSGQKPLIPVDLANKKSSILHLKTFHPLNDWYCPSLWRAVYAGGGARG